MERWLPTLYIMGHLGLKGRGWMRFKLLRATHHKWTTPVGLSKPIGRSSTTTPTTLGPHTSGMLWPTGHGPPVWDCPGDDVALSVGEMNGSPRPSADCGYWEMNGLATYPSTSRVFMPCCVMMGLPEPLAYRCHWLKLHPSGDSHAEAPRG